VADLLEIVGERLLRGALATPEAGNVDQQRYPQGMPLPGADESAAMLARIHHRAAELQRLYAMLDSRSAQLLIDRLVFLVLGPQRAQLGPPIETIHELLAFARGVLITEFDVCDLDYGDGTHTHRFDLRPLGYPLDVESYMFGVQGTFQLQQYRCPDTPQAWPRPGDVAIDAGGFFGETALWLACLTGPQGRVLSLEFAAHNLPFMRANLEANPEFAAQVSVLERALWDESGIELPISLGGPATTVTGGEGYALVPSITVDDILAEGHLDRVDFIKMDIEGAEPNALLGARQTLRQFRPRLALAAYHDFDHVWQLAASIDSLGLGYHFALGHFTVHDEETVLFAWVPGT
jgi:FkbM family methyltransferase